MAVCNRQGVWLLDPFVSVDLHGGPLCAGSHDAALISFPSSYAPVVKEAGNNSATFMESILEAGNNSASLAFCRLLLYVITTNGMRLGAEADSGKSIGSWKQQCKPSFLSIVALRGLVKPMDNLPASNTPRLHFVAALNHPSSFLGDSSPLPSPSQCRRRLANRPTTVRLSPPPSPRLVSPPPLNTVRCGCYTLTPLDIAACPPLSRIGGYKENKEEEERIRGAHPKFSLHFSLSSIGDDEQPTTTEINFFYKVPLHFSLSSIDDDE
uniref:Uncharacterized protein n=1 Tax=Oryza rufipogon TaxID=4529 RepID=A0A0E0MUB8_ORYRU